MKLAFVILAHRYPEQLARLVKLLSSDGDDCLIHIDRRAAALLEQTQRLLGDLVRTPQVVFVKQRSACRWGQFSIVNATLNCLNQMRQQAQHSGYSEPYDYIVLISGQCYPIKPLAQIKRFLAAHRGQQFIEAFPILEPNPWTEQAGPYQAARRVFNWHGFFRSRHFYLPFQRTLPKGLIPYGGSQWWALSGDCVAYLLAELDAHPEVIQYFKYTFIPDELFFQTLVANSPFQTALANRCLTYLDWSNPNPTPPKVLGLEDFEQLANSDYLFARKFDPHRSQDLLTLIDQRLLSPPKASSLPRDASLPRDDSELC
ncbi:MAG: beta-1,6-N-acetylglucosaminyltransferase [Elainella sp.]